MYCSCGSRLVCIPCRLRALAPDEQADDATLALRLAVARGDLTKVEEQAAEEARLWALLADEKRKRVQHYEQIIASRRNCGLCDKGFPLNHNSLHYGTQKLGMIPLTFCAKKPPSSLEVET